MDCQTTSVEFPAYDGQVGLWYDHMPMFCNLGLGIMKVKHIGNDQQMDDVFVLVDGGFSMVCSNQLQVVSYDVIFPRDLTPDDVEQITTSLKKDISSDALDPQQRQHQARKLALLTQLLDRASQGAAR